MRHRRSFEGRVGLAQRCVELVCGDVGDIPNRQHWGAITDRAADTRHHHLGLLVQAVREQPSSSVLWRKLSMLTRKGGRGYQGRRGCWQQTGRLDGHFDCTGRQCVQRSLGQEKFPVASRFRWQLSCWRTTAPKCGTWAFEGQASRSFCSITPMIGHGTARRLPHGTSSQHQVAQHALDCRRSHDESIPASR
jgi:hypothetical protein